jgi:hypothetical protein
LDGETFEQIRTLLRNEVDWRSLIQLALRHAVMPLVYRSLSAFPIELLDTFALDKLKFQFYKNVRNNLFLSHALIQLMSLLKSHKIHAIPYKGPVLAASVYGNLGLRQFGDIDILVHEADFDRTKDHLLLHSFKLTHEYGWASTFEDRNGQFEVDVHRAITPRIFPFQIDFQGLWDRITEVKISGHTVPSLCPNDLVLILCIQAAKDSWENRSQLAKICDIAELLQAHPNINWPWVFGEARRQGAEGMLCFGLVLVQNLLGAELPKNALERIEKHHMISLLATQVQKRFSTEVCFRKTDLSEKAKFHSRLRERMRDRIPYHFEPIRRCIERSFIPNDRDRAFLKLPQTIHFIYYLLRLVRLFRDYGLSPVFKRLRLYMREF